MESNEMEVTQPLPTTNLEQLERLAIEQSLTQHNGNRTHAWNGPNGGFVEGSGLRVEGRKDQ